MTEQRISENYLSYLQGGKKIDVDQAIQDDAEQFARTVAYVIENGGYHRDTLALAVAKLINKPMASQNDKEARLYRDVAWAIMQMPNYPLSHMMIVVDRAGDDKKLNTRRLRMALAHRIANSGREELIRVYFLAPDRFRRMFSDMYLMRDKCDNREITNKSYKLAYEMSQTSTDKFAKKHKITCGKLAKYGVPLNMVMQRVSTPKEAVELAGAVSSDDFLRHARWFRNAMGDTEFEKHAEQMAKKVKDPMSFLSIKDHLEETGAISSKLSTKLETRASEVMNDMLKTYDIERLALLVDISWSMDAGVEVTQKLYKAFSKADTGITDLIAFNHMARTIAPRELEGLRCSSQTSIGSAVVNLAQGLKLRDGDLRPQAIILVSDMGENTRPYLPQALEMLEEYGSPPLIILWIGSDKRKMDLNYPHAYIDIADFQPRLLKDIMERIIRLTSKVAVKEKKTTEILKKRDIEAEDLGEIQLPMRPEETLKTGYMRSILCN